MSLKNLAAVLLLGIAAGCAGADAPGAPGPLDAGAGTPGDVAAEVGAGGSADGAADQTVAAPADAPSAGGCASACAAGEFCGVASRTCVSAVKAVAAGTFHTCALHGNGRISCWGDSRFIAPGLGKLVGPIDVPLGGRALAIAAGAEAACALLEDKSVRCWGVLGGTTRAPTLIVNEDGAALAGVTQIAGGTQAFCASTPAGTHCWGENRASEMARPPGTAFPATTAVLSQAGARPLLAATVAILVHDGVSQLCGWGNNDSGIVPGPRGIVERPTCVDKIDNVLQLSAGDGHVCARRGGARFSCWGSNSGGQLGTGDDSLLDVPLPGQIRSLPAGIVHITTGGYHTCALLDNGMVMCWGSNEHGECGVPASSPHFSPVVAATPRFVSIASGAEASHTCGLLEDGAVACWGTDERAQLGSGATSEDANRMSAVPVAVRF